VFNLTSKLQSKILQRQGAPTINVKNINFINVVDKIKGAPLSKPNSERKIPNELFVFFSKIYLIKLE